MELSIQKTFWECAEQVSSLKLHLSSQIPSQGTRPECLPTTETDQQTAAKKRFIWTIRELYPKVMMLDLDAALENFTQKKQTDYNFSGAV